MNYKIYLVLFVSIFASLSVSAQRYFTRTGELSFYSSTPVEDIKAVNSTVTAVIDVPSKAVQLSATIKGFHFEKALMEEHFNENYMESDAFPKATFKGTISNLGEDFFTREGKNELTISGKLTIHGVTKEIKVKGLIVKGEKIVATTTFKVKPEDYNIEIPSVVRDKIAREIEITATLELQKK